MKAFTTGWIIIFTLLLSACGTDTASSSSPNATQDSSPSGQGVTVTDTGPPPSEVERTRLTIRITDAPADNARRVLIGFSAVELRSQAGGFSKLFTFNEIKSIDLLTLQGTATAVLLDGVEIESGIYDEIRLLISDTPGSNFIELSDGATHELTIPSGEQSGLKLNGTFNLPANRPARFTVDFDVRQSVVRAGQSGNYLLKPVLRVVDDSAIGHIRGSVDAQALVAPSCSDSDIDSHNAVYVFDGHGVNVDDIDRSSDSDIDPVATGSITYDASSDSYVYEAAFLTPGDYTIALTCNADAEDIEADDELQFFAIRDVTVVVNNTQFL